MLENQIMTAELQLVMLAAEHNLPFLLFEHLPEFLRSLPDKNVLNNIKCSRTKATSLINNKIGPFAQAAIAEKLKKTFFSVIIDEATDISNTKCLAIVVRFFNTEEQNVSDVLFCLAEVSQATAEAIFNTVVSAFKKHSIPIHNIIGFASDNASVMMGQINGVKARFEQILPNIYVMGCLSHSLHLCASKACSSIPSNVENFIRSVYNYFAHSAKRQREFVEFQQFANVEPHRLLRACQTRWLSLNAVVARVVEQWAALELYFQSESLEENVYGADVILLDLRNIEIKLYCLFMQHILNIISKMNVQFQSEKPQINVLLPNITTYYAMILKFYMRNEIVQKHSIEKINPKNPDYFLELDKMYLGAAFEKFISTSVTKPTAQQLHRVRLNCLNFYLTLCSEIRSRIDFKNELLNDIANTLNMNTIFTDQNSSIVKIARHFPNIVNDQEMENLNLEWRLLREHKTKEKIETIEALIVFLNRQKNSVGESPFKNLTKFLEYISCLPHSSAAVERVFSQLTIIKTKYRNSLAVQTIENLLLTKELLGANSCFNWKPSDELLKFKKN